jgi:hypothetical protein
VIKKKKKKQVESIILGAAGRAFARIIVACQNIAILTNNKYIWQRKRKNKCTLILYIKQRLFLKEIYLFPDETT